jgi:hypothetical protein
VFGQPLADFTGQFVFRVIFSRPRRAEHGHQRTADGWQRVKAFDKFSYDSKESPRIAFAYIVETVWTVLSAAAFISHAVSSFFPAGWSCSPWNWRKELRQRKFYLPQKAEAAWLLYDKRERKGKWKAATD